MTLGVHVEWRDVEEEVSSSSLLSLEKEEEKASSSLRETFERAFRKAVREQIDASFADVETRPV
jgi:hypothetical protein